uniref:Uncharacterized protein n=1 Tax=Zea mays TaxID=4577 RepID=A0A804P4W5_MAIZE
MAGRGGLWLLPPHDAATGAPQIGRDLFRTQAGRFGIPRASWAWPADNRIALPWKQEKAAIEYIHSLSRAQPARSLNGAGLCPASRSLSTQAATTSSTPQLKAHPTSSSQAATTLSKTEDEKN